MIDLSYTWIDVKCPRCHYLDDIQLIDVKIEKLHFCHNCKVTIQVQDYEGTMHAGLEAMNDAFKKLNGVFKKFNR